MSPRFISCIGLVSFKESRNGLRTWESNQPSFHWALQVYALMASCGLERALCDAGNGCEDTTQPWPIPDCWHCSSFRGTVECSTLLKPSSQGSAEITVCGCQKWADLCGQHRSLCFLEYSVSLAGLSCVCCFALWRAWVEGMLCPRCHRSPCDSKCYQLCVFEKGKVKPPCDTALRGRKKPWLGEVCTEISSSGHRESAAVLQAAPGSPPALGRCFCPKAVLPQARERQSAVPALLSPKAYLQQKGLNTSVYSIS